MKTRPNRRFKPVNPATLLLVKQFILGLLLFCVVGLIITGIWYGTRLQTFTISAINVSGGKTISAKIVHGKINDKLSGTYLGLIPKRFTYFYPREEILKSLYEIERLKGVQIDVVHKKTLQVVFSEYFPEALWCDKNEKKSCLFLDETGYAFATAPKLSGGSFLRYYSIDMDSSRGARPLSSEDYLITKDFVKLLNDSGWFVNKVEVDSVRDVFYLLADGGEIKATLLDGPLTPYTYLQTLLDSDEFKHLEPGNFQYIDIRFGKKIFVNEEIVVETEVEGIETATSSEVVIPAVTEETVTASTTN